MYVEWMYIITKAFRLIMDSCIRLAYRFGAEKGRLPDYDDVFYSHSLMEKIWDKKTLASTGEL